MIRSAYSGTVSPCILYDEYLASEMEEKEKENKELDLKKDVEVPATLVVEEEESGEHINGDEMQKIRENKLLKSALIIERMLREKDQIFQNQITILYFHYVFKQGL